MKIRRRICLLAKLMALALWSFAASAEITAQTAILDQAATKRAQIYEHAILEAATKHGVDARVLWVIAYLETRFNPALVSRRGARGMMQFMPATAGRFDLTSPHDPTAAIDAAARYVRFLGNRFSNRADLILAAYNSGEATVDAYLTGRSIKVGNRIINPRGLVTRGIPPYRETRGYVNHGLKLLSVLPQKWSLLPQTDLPRNERIDLPSRPVHKSFRPRSESASIDAVPVPGRRSIYFVRAPGEN